MEGIPVTLIVKAPNQQIEDQTIQCEITWTISKLKGHLAEVYPNKPTLEEQKIIYSGQLLNDTTVLKDVLRKYDGDNSNVHTMHLVCLPRRIRQNVDTKKSQDAHKEGLRHRNVAANQTGANPSGSRSTDDTSAQERVTDSNPAQPENETDQTNWSADWNTNWMRYATQNPQAFNYRFGVPTDSAGPYQWTQDPRYPIPPFAPNQMNAGAHINNQFAWMQYMYMQYMQHYNNMVAGNGTFPQMQYPYQYAHLQNPQPNVYETVQAEHVAVGGEGAEARAANQNEDVADAPQQRDWLDRMYLMVRWLALFLIVYFYSSPVRFALVLSLGIIIYVYNMGFFRPIPARIVMPHERLAEDRERAAAEQHPEGPLPPDANLEQGNLNPEGNNPEVLRQPENAEATRAPENPEQDPTNQNTLLTITWTIFTSFFTSLIPEAQNTL